MATREIPSPSPASFYYAGGTGSGKRGLRTSINSRRTEGAPSLTSEACWEACWEADWWDPCCGCELPGGAAASGEAVCVAGAKPPGKKAPLAAIACAAASDVAAPPNSAHSPDSSSPGPPGAA